MMDYCGDGGGVEPKTIYRERSVGFGRLAPDNFQSKIKEKENSSFYSTERTASPPSQHFIWERSKRSNTKIQNLAFYFEGLAAREKFKRFKFIFSSSSS